MSAVILKPDREKSLLRRHPWIFSGAVDGIEGNPGSGDTVDVISSAGLLLGRGAYSPSSQIRVRIWTFDPHETVSSEFFRSRIQRALRLRRSLGLFHPEGACRVVHGESDGLPGLIVDLYADYLVCQFLTAGTERWKGDILGALMEHLPAAGIYERSDMEIRGRETLQPVAGPLVGREPPELLIIREGPCLFSVDIRRGHKTGFYLDQRDNRALIASYAGGREVMNAFAYTGAFGIHALKAGAARVTHVESSRDSLDLARRNLELNGLDASAAEHIEGNVFQVLRHHRDTGRHYDLIVLDPPKFVENQSHLERASRGYKDINLLAFMLLRQGGILFTFSCSGLMPPPLFQKIVADAALDAGREAHILHRLGQAADHPTALAFPEGSYLKGLVCRVV